MLSVRLSGDMLEVKFETMMGGKQYAKIMNLLQELPDTHFIEDKYIWITPKEHVDYFLKEIGEDNIAWHTSIEDIKGIQETILPSFKVTEDGLDDMKLKPYPFQTVGICFLYEAKRALLADEMGLGKTPTAIGAVHRLWKEGTVSKALVICPSSLKYQWADELQKFTDHKGIVIDGTPKQRLAQYTEWQNSDEYLFAIMNYELVRNDIETLLELNYDVMICDEIHRIKNWKSKTSEAMKQLDSPYKFGLTGTPMQNAPEELWNIMDFLDASILGNFWAFNSRYIVRGDKFNQKNVVLGYKRLGELRRRVSNEMLRRMKKDVAPDLPEMTFHPYRIEMSPDQRKLQEILREDFMKLLDEIRESQIVASATVEEGQEEVEHPKQGQIMGFFNLMIACADSPELFHMSDSKMVQRYAQHVKPGVVSPKIKELVEICKEQMEQGNTKIVIFTQFERMQQLIVSELSKLGGVEILNGKMKPFERQASVDRFKYNHEVNFFVTTDAGNYGINLQFSNVLVNVDLPWNPAIYDQRNGRVHRIGSEHDRVNIIDLIMRDTIDERIEEVLYKKKELAAQIVEKNDVERAAMNRMTAGILKKLVKPTEPKKKSKK